jgi:hypothetical protein
MRHAQPSDLDALEPLLAELRTVPGLVERKRGLFTHRSKAFLHFHADPTGLFADVRLDGDDFTRHRVSTAAEQAELLTAVRAAVAPQISP